MIQYNSGIKPIPDFAASIITDILKRSGNDSCLATSTNRTPEDQARIMYHNCKYEGIRSQLKLYGSNGDKVIYAYRDTIDEFKRDVVEYVMAEKIREIGAQKVSKHCVDDPDYAVFDIAPSSLSCEDGFESVLINDSRITKYIRPNGDPAYHIEIENVH